MSFNCVKKVENDYDKYVLVSTAGKIVLPDYLDKKSKDLAKAVIEKNEKITPCTNCNRFSNL